MSATGQGRHIARIVGANIRRGREGLGLTQHELALDVGGKTSGQQVSDWERGVNQPSETNLLALAQRLDHELAWFFVDRDDERVAA